MNITSNKKGPFRHCLHVNYIYGCFQHGAIFSFLHTRLIFFLVIHLEYLHALY